MPATLDSVVGRSLVAFDAAVSVGEAIEDEWQYLGDLRAVWRARLTTVATARGAEPLAADVVAAVDAAIEELAGIEDPHRVIDWLSTFPQVVLLALGEAA